MIKDIIQHNEIAKGNERVIDILHRDFPQCFTSDGKFDIELFKGLVSETIPTTHEGYSLQFLGKSYASLVASTDTTTVIVPDEEHNSKPENVDSKNIYISGDNLDALKHLRNSYSEAIKFIYIDPPYNTGSDGFVYNDNFNYTSEQLQNRLGISEESAARILEMTTKGSASHSAWLAFMFPRLMLARDLLTPDGIIFISIDDNEQANLKLLCDSIFGEENLLAQIIVQANKRGQTYKQLAKTHEYLLVYSKTEEVIVRELIKELSQDTKADSVSEYTERELRNRNPKYGRFNRPNLFYPIYVNPEIVDENGYSPISLEKSLEFPIEVLPYNSEGDESCWRWGTKKFSSNNDNDSMRSNVVARKKSSGEYGIYEKYRKGTYKAKTIWTDIEIIDDEDDEDTVDSLTWDETGVITEQGTTELKKYGMGDLFDFPKPTYLLKKILSIGSDLDSICLDFFSGSGTLADAVFQLNAVKGNRRFITVQLPLNLQDKYNHASSSDKPKIKKVLDFLEAHHYPATLDYIGFERIIRATNKIKESCPGFKGNLGFKHYTLQEPSDQTLAKLEDFNPHAIFVDNMLDEFGKDTVLCTWALRDGYGLDAELTPIDLDGYTAYLCGRHLYFVTPNLLNYGGPDSIVALIERYSNDKFFKPENIVLFGYSFTYTETEALRKNLLPLRDSIKNLKVNLDIRY